LAVVNALQPVSKAGAAGRIYGVHPEGGLVEEWAHLDAHLPEASANAEEAPEGDAVDHVGQLTVG